MRRIRRNPMLLAVPLLLSLWGHLLWNAGAGAVAPALAIRVKVPWGYVAPRVPLTQATLRDGAWQRAAGLRVGAASWMQHDAVRWRNQAYYTLFAMSGAPGITLGRDRELFERAYMLDFCTRDVPALTPALDAWARRLRAVHDAAPHALRYLITPSKVATDPSVLPDGLVCPVDRAAAAQKLPVFRAALARAGVAAIDGPLLLADLPGAPHGLFPRGGIHWNATAALAATEALAASVADTPAAVTPFTAETRTRAHPEGEERDLLDTLNLIAKDDRYAVPEVTLRQAPDAACVRPRWVFVSGSFGLKVARSLAALPCAPIVDFYFYWDRAHFRVVGGALEREDADPAQRDAALRAADLIVLEENDATLPASGHAQSLAAWLGVR